jgi:hypothetical protein
VIEIDAHRVAALVRREADRSHVVGVDLARDHAGGVDREVPDRREVRLRRAVVVERERDPRREPVVDAGRFERCAEVVARRARVERVGERRDPRERLLGGLDHPPVAGVGVDRADRLGADRGEHPVGVLGLEGPGLARYRDEHRRLGAL